MKHCFVITSFNQLQDFINVFIPKIKSGQLIGLIGELGSGKTTFVKYLAKELGIDPDQIISPTFIYEQIYSVPQSQYKIARIHHLDLYRLNNQQDFDALGFEVKDEQGIFLIEWIDRVSTLQKQAHYLLEFKFDGKKRTIKLRSKNDKL